MNKIKEGYQQKFRKYGVDPRSLFWASRGAAHQRFRQFWAEIDFSNKRVLDVGCGFGEMAKFLLKRYENVDYTGVDIVPEFIEEARKLYPECKFEVRDILTNPMDGNFDVVLASGVLNSNLPGGRQVNMDYRKNAIATFFEHTKRVLAFNMLGGHPRPTLQGETNVWYTDSLEILEYCMGLTRRVILRHHYNPRDFTIFMYKTKK